MGKGKSHGHGAGRGQPEAGPEHGTAGIEPLDYRTHMLFTPGGGRGEPKRMISIA